MTDQDSSSKEFMLTYYPTIYQRHYYEREAGDKSFNTFLTLASAIIAGVLLLVSNQVDILNIYIIVLTGLGILLLIGIVTYERICTRSITSIRWLMRANLALQYFTEIDGRLEKYVRPHRINELTESWWQSFQLGGLTRTAAILNILPALGIVIVLTRFILRFDVGLMAIITVTVGLLVWLLQVLIWRSKLRKLQTIVAPSFDESVTGKSASFSTHMPHPVKVNQNKSKLAKTKPDR